ncbi:hypothetical protein MCOR27_001647 [Pyricularia oryzae]|uniref:Hydrophobin n=3 Tax=Pyricularia TaxID=48558 RepID=A0ABQ8NWT7_PYRGI|nr:uncharacterized protein MGG_04354 [Pyricularia oryzae 70-15]KAH8837615.1 hypothetical protein MCOR01_011222 [Pyricularia oryzae]KAI6303238.1 hypothetical protein MCOR33_001504 [Pyricularia grisea]EHA53657.1 hypothetical protein MGG_04354 [Pyricularia oryzae 70-15]KAH9437700.1 hypothetical protein MCOR02_001353 [Pyricularia oryzae]KAI6256586.1 hypothetical protein MCOR19_006957 [Pyricularia oryzae]
MQFFTSLVVIALAFTGIATASPATNVKINKPTVSKPVINKPDVKNTSQEVTCGNNMTPFCCVTDFSTAAGDKNKKNGGSKGKETTTCSKSVASCGGTIVCCNSQAFGSGNADQSCSAGVTIVTETKDINLKDAIFMDLKQI